MCASSGLMQCSKTPPLPDVPALADFLPGYEANAWIGIGAPKKTPVEIIDQLNKEINVGFADPKIAARIADLASRAFIASPADLDKLVVEYTEKWGKVRQRTSRPSDHNLVGRTFHVRIPKTRGPLREFILSLEPSNIARPAAVDAGLAICVGKARPVAHQSITLH